MTGSQKLLLSAALVLTILGMSFGLWYALVDEHPTLERMGIALASTFAEVAKGDMNAAGDFLDSYGKTRGEYIRDVHTHSHLTALSTLLLILGLIFNQLAFPERVRKFLAILLSTGALALPLGSFLEMFFAGPVPMILALSGTICLICGLAAAAAGLIRRGNVNSAV